jgi:putative phosphoserine phosphatase/1-acylglycerol-3-phosphate O-acyltransferase
MARSAAFFDLDRTLLRGASGPIISQALREEGLLGTDRIPGERLLFGLFDLVGETLPSMALTRQGARAAKGWSVAAVRRAGARAASQLADAVEPFAREVIADHRAAGRSLVLATTTPHDLVVDFAERLGFDEVLATHYRVGPGQRYDGTIDGEFVWSRGKARAATSWARAHRVELVESYAYSDSIYDVPLLRAVGHPVAVNPDPRLWAYASLRGWETVWFSAPPGVPKPFGLEPQQMVAALARNELLPWVNIVIEGLDNVPAQGGALLAPNHRSYLDPLIVGFAGSKMHRPVRFLAKKEVTDAPIVGHVTRALGAIRVDRGGETESSMIEATRALRAGELVALFPQGTIPRGEAFFDPVLKGRFGAVRLAMESGAPLIPIGIWGTEAAWPRNRSVPYVLNLADPPTVTVAIGEPYHPSSEDLEEATEELMRAIVALLPAEARMSRTPSEAELAATHPSGHDHG